MKKVFVLLLLFTGVGLFADTTFYAYSPQQVQTFSDLLTYLSFFFDKGTNTGATYLSLLKFIVLFGTLVTTVNMAKDFNSKNPNASHSSLFDFAKYQIFVIAMLSVLYGTYDNVVVTDPASGQVGVSAKIPLIFAKTIGFFSEFEYKMTDLAEYAFKDIRSPSSGWDIQNYGTSGLGYGGVPDGVSLAGLMTLKTLDMHKLSGVTKDLSPMFTELLTECIVTPLSSNGGNDNPSDLFYSKNLLEKIQNIFNNHVNIKNIPLSKIYYGDDTCGKLWNDTKGTINHYINDSNNTMLRTRKANKFISSLSYALYMRNNSDSSNLIADASKAKQALMQVMLGNETNNLFNKLGVAGNVYAAGANKSLADIQYTGMGVAMMMQKYLPLLSFMLFAIMTGAFPFIFAFALLPGGFNSIINYVKTLAWVSLWGPMAAILNFFVDRRLGEIYSKVIASGSYTTLLEPAHIVADISSSGGEMAGLAGMLFLSVPGLSWMLVSGSGVMLGNIAGIIGGSFTKNISPDTVMQDATQLQAAKEASMQMDKKVGVAEMAEFEARRQAATEGGAYSGAIKAMKQGGFGMSEFATMSEVQSASEIGQSNAFANQVGNGTNAAFAGSIQGAQAGAQTMATANTIGSTSNAAFMGNIESTQSASAALSHARKIGSATEAARVGRVEGGAKAGGEIGQTNAYDGSADEAYNTNRKAALGSESEKRKHFQQLSDDQIATNAANRGYLSGRTEAKLADKLNAKSPMELLQDEETQANYLANKDVSQFDSAQTAIDSTTKRKGVSRKKTEEAVMTTARLGAASQIAGEAATVLGEQNAIGGSLAGAMMTNSIEMGLWNGAQSGANAHILENKSLASEKVVTKHEAIHHGVGAVFGEYDNWQKINEEGRAAKKKLVAEKSHINKEISDIKSHMGKIAQEQAKVAQEQITEQKEKTNMFKHGGAKNIFQWRHDFDKIEKEKKDLEAKKETATNKYVEFTKHYGEYLHKYGEKAAHAKLEELRHNIQSHNSVINKIQKKEAQIKDLNAKEKAVDQALDQNKKVYSTDNFGAKRFIQTVMESSEGAGHSRHIATSAQNARAIGNLNSSITDAKGAEIIYRNSMGVSNAQLGEQIAVDGVGAIANKVQAAKILGQGYIQQVYNKGSAASQNVMNSFGYGHDSIHSLSAIAATSILGTRSIIDGEDVYTSYNAATGGLGSDIATSKVGINDIGVYNRDLKIAAIKGLGGNTISQMQNRATVVTGITDAINLGVSLTSGKIFNAAKHIAGNGVFRSLKDIGSTYIDAASNIGKDLGGFRGKDLGGFRGKAGGEFDSEPVNVGIEGKNQ